MSRVMDTEILEGLKRDCIVCEGVVKLRRANSYLFSIGIT